MAAEAIRWDNVDGVRDRPHAESVVLPFSAAEVGLIRSLASQSAVAIDKARLIRKLGELPEPVARQVSAGLVEMFTF